ncbi:unnamed protein product, partial [Mesorhabditis spiculigera]
MSFRRIQACFVLLVLLPVFLLAQEMEQEELRPFVAIMPPFLRMDRRAISKFIQTRQEPKRYANTLDKSTLKLWRSSASMIYQLKKMQQAGMI